MTLSAIICQTAKKMSYLCIRKRTHRYLVHKTNLKTLMSNPQNQLSHYGNFQQQFHLGKNPQHPHHHPHSHRHHLRCTELYVTRPTPSLPGHSVREGDKVEDVKT